MGSKTGVIKIAAKRIGIPIELYIHYTALNLKYCFDCKQWIGKELFRIDRSRGDGLASTCDKCRSTTKNKINKPVREKMLRLGYGWCRGCKKWHPADMVKRGACQAQINKEDRTRYKTDEIYRYNRIQHSISRKRDIAPLPIYGAEFLLDSFDGKCAYCCGPANTWDHIIPVVKGGMTEPGNIVPACSSCNSSKKDKGVFEWIAEKNMPCHPELEDVMNLGVMNGVFSDYFDNMGIL